MIKVAQVAALIAFLMVPVLGSFSSLPLPIGLASAVFTATESPTRN